VPESVPSQCKFCPPDTILYPNSGGGDDEIHELQSNSDEIDPDDPLLEPVPLVGRQSLSPSPEKEAPSTHTELQLAAIGVQPPPVAEEFDPELFEIEGSTTVFCECCCRTPHGVLVDCLCKPCV
jgi:hypothetical protein